MHLFYMKIKKNLIGVFEFKNKIDQYLLFTVIEKNHLKFGIFKFFFSKNHMFKLQSVNYYNIQLLNGIL